MQTRILSIATVTFLTAATSLFAACGDETGSSGTQSTASSSATTTSSSTSASSTGVGGGGEGGQGQGGQGQGGGAGGGKADSEVIWNFDPGKGEFVEGLDYTKGIAYVGVLLTGAVIQVDVAAKTAKPFGNMPAFEMNKAALIGLTVGPDGAVYGALNASAADAPPTGVYRIPPGGGAAVMFATHPEMIFGNDLRFDDAGDLFVSDAVAGAVFKVAKANKAVTKWVQADILKPDPDVCKVQTQYHLGLNGIVRRGDAYYGTNTDRASIVKIPVNADGSAGTPEVYIASDCAALSGADGIALDPKTQDLFVAVNYQDKILRIKSDKTMEMVFKGEPLQSPASLVVDTDHNELLVTSAAFAALAIDPKTAKPALVSLPLP